MQRVFLLSPARLTGKRAQILLRPQAAFPLAVRLRSRGAPLGEIFSFMSGLYFRGKRAYAAAFAAPPPEVPASFVITAAWGLVPTETVVTPEDLQALANGSIDVADETYLSTVTRHAQQLKKTIKPECAIVLLGSVATTKYAEPLRTVFGESLLFPELFTGRGDLSRGGLLLRSVQNGVELTYKPVGSATHHGPRPARLVALASKPSRRI